MRARLHILIHAGRDESSGYKLKSGGGACVIPSERERENGPI